MTSLVPGIGFKAFRSATIFATLAGSVTIRPFSLIDIGVPMTTGPLVPVEAIG